MQFTRIAHLHVCDRLAQHLAEWHHVMLQIKLNQIQLFLAQYRVVLAESYMLLIPAMVPHSDEWQVPHFHVYMNTE